MSRMGGQQTRASTKHPKFAEKYLYSRTPRVRDRDWYTVDELSKKIRPLLAPLKKCARAPQDPFQGRIPSLKWGKIATNPHLRGIGRFLNVVYLSHSALTGAKKEERMQDVVQLKAKVPQTLKRQAFSVMALRGLQVFAMGPRAITAVSGKPASRGAARSPHDGWRERWADAVKARSLRAFTTTG